MKPVLEIRNISKKFLISHQQLPYLTLRDKVAGMFKPRSSKEEFWALEDISFEVTSGESIGIIGRNGAGKSTLLKILSRITPPTSGKIVVRGRIASLLEVGTGFHQELTGRENIFMNGSILGMRNSEIKKRFDEIVDFSGVEKFLDTPLKHYSSGMQLRLAFAVAAHLEPEILIIDEVLAVGDSDFQRKCIGKMEDVSKSGRTIVFVSHNMDAVESLCKTSVYLADGKVVDRGNSRDIIQKYISNSEHISFHPIELSPNSRLDEFSTSEQSLVSGTPFHFRIKITQLGAERPVITDLCLLFYNYKKQRVAIYDLRKHQDRLRFNNGFMCFEGKINSLNLIEGAYYLGLYFGIDLQQGDLYDLIKLQVKDDITTEKVKPYENQYRGFVQLI